MKRLITSILALLMLFSLCGCRGNFGSIGLRDAIQIPEDGIIKKSTIEQIKEENAVATFYGQSNDCKYEWTIFGSDIAEPKQIHLAVIVAEAADGSLEIQLSQAEPFGFSALLSVSLEGKWEAQSATAYSGGKAVASVSLTGTKSTILNLSLDGSLRELAIRPDELPPDETLPAETDSKTDETAKSPTAGDDYLSQGKDNDSSVYTDGKDKYLTDPIPEGKPNPVEPEDAQVNAQKKYTCTFSIECSTILNNLSDLEPGKLEMVPSSGVILEATTVSFCEGESVFDVLQRICREKGIHLESSWTPIYNSAYVEGIHNLYEFDCGNLSGWMYRVNGWYPNYGCSRYQLKQGDIVEWRYTCDLGNDVGGGYAVGG